MTVLEAGQWKVRGLVMGPHTPYRVIASSNSFPLGIRAEHSRIRPNAHGGLVGAEWANPKTMPIRVMVDAEPYTESAWLDAIDDLTSAFGPVGASGEMVELYRNIDGREFVWFGRTRMVEPETDLAAGGYGFVQCAFEAADPRRYTAEMSTVSTGLAVQRGGLRVSAELVSSEWRRGLRLPLRIPGTTQGGRVEVTNLGTTATGGVVRIDGPVPEPRLVLERSDRTVQSISFDLTLGEGQWLVVDLVRKRALLNGLVEANQRGSATWLMDAFPFLPGVNRLRFLAADYEPAAMATVEYRSAWW